MSADADPPDLLQLELPDAASWDEEDAPLYQIDLWNNLQIASPCDASWDAMDGDDLVRFCPHCRLNVYNLSSMSRQEAAAFVRQAEDRLCVRFYHRRDGTVLTKDCPVGWRAVRRWLLECIGSTLATALGLAWLVAPTTGPPPRMGSVRARHPFLLPADDASPPQPAPSHDATPRRRHHRRRFRHRPQR